MDNKPAKKKLSVATQQYLDIAEIKEGAVIMRDGTLRSVILVSSINFALKSEDEQNAIIGAYVSFLNNIDFPLQIVVQSRELNIEGYLDSLRQKAREQTNELLKMQTNEYVEYIKELVAMAKIMNKRFYVAVLYNPLSDRQKNFFSRLLDVFKPSKLMRMKEDKFRRRKAELDRRVDNIISGLSSIGLNAIPLDTQGLIELFYSTYNPTTAISQKLVDVNELRLAE
jgi:hypothetical protein